MDKTLNMVGLMRADKASIKVEDGQIYALPLAGEFNFVCMQPESFHYLYVTSRYAESGNALFCLQLQPVFYHL